MSLSKKRQTRFEDIAHCHERPKTMRTICIFCRHASPLSKRKPSVQRSFSTKQEPYVLPRLVIDLDASDSEIVREVEADEIREEPFSRRRRIFLNLARPKTKNREPLSDAVVVGPEDLLRYALHGDPRLYPTVSNGPLRDIFRAKSILPLQTADEKIQQLVSRFSTDPVKNLERAGFDLRGDQLIRDRLRKPPNLKAYSRLISIIAATTDGCKILALAGADIAEGIRRCRITWHNLSARAGKVSDEAAVKLTEMATGAAGDASRVAAIAPDFKFLPSTVVTLLCDLRLNMASKGVQFPAILCSVGLYYAAKIDFIPAVKVFLDEILRNSHPNTWYTLKALISFQRQRGWLELPTNSPWAPWLTERERQAVSNSLLTGYEWPSKDLENQSKRACFADLMDLPLNKRVGQTHQGHANGMYRTYISGLGELGLTQLLWNEWLASGASGQRVTTLHEHPIAELFFVSFLVARDTTSALYILEQAVIGQNDASSIDTVTKPTFSKAARSLIQLLSSKTESMPFLQELILAHYSYHRLVPSRSLENVLWQLNPDQSPVDVITDIDKLLLTSYRGAEDSTWGYGKKLVEWHESSEYNGITVSVAGENERSPRRIYQKYP